MLYFMKPENGLKRAKEFLDVGKKQRALDVLADVIKSRRHRTWQKIHDNIMQMYVNLCVDLKRSHQAKEGLFQYRNICQQVNIKSLEDIVRLYLRAAEERTEAARQDSHQQVIDIDDLDNVQTPEGLLLSAVSSEDSQDRTDRVILLPWVKFLWESYRQCLELLRNNSRVERLYHEIAQQAFRFCLKYNRKTEFRKLCDNLRAHLGHIYKHQAQQTAVNLNHPESQAMHLETRLVQLDNAITMELWQEAYKAIEDIHDLMAMAKKAPKPNLMATYFQKLGLVFHKAGDHLNHASALLRLFQLSRELKKNITPDEIQKMATWVMLATLAVPLAPSRPDLDRLVETDESIIDKNNRALSTLLNLSTPPTRSSLVKDMVRLGIYNASPSIVQELYRLLEVDMHPVKLCPRVSAILTTLTDENAELKQYVGPIQEMAVARLLRSISQVYTSISFEHLMEMIPFVDLFHLERLVVDCARRNDLQVRINHVKQGLYFGFDFNISQREEVVDGPHIQAMNSENTRVQLMKLHSVLSGLMPRIQPPDQVQAALELKYHLVASYEKKEKNSHKKMLDRRQIIEERKEMLENLNLIKEEEERKQLEEKQQKLREAEKERVARETEERTRLRQLQEAEEFRKKRCRERLAQLKKTEAGARVAAKIEEQELENLDPEELLSRQFAQIDKEQKDYQAKLRKQEKKLDHLERAKRQEEIPLLIEQYQKQRLEDERSWEQLENERIQRLIIDYEQNLKIRARLMQMAEDKKKFLHYLTEKRSAAYQEKLHEFEELLNQERAERLKQRAQERKEERRQKYLQQKAEEEERKKEQAALEEAEAKKRARERELRKEDEDRAPKRDEVGPWRPSALRREGKAPEESWRRGTPKDDSPWRKDDDKRPPRRILDQDKDWRKNDSRDSRSFGDLNRNVDSDKNRNLDRKFETDRERGFGKDFPRSRDGDRSRERFREWDRDNIRDGERTRFRDERDGERSKFRDEKDGFRRDDKMRFRDRGGERGDWFSDRNERNERFGEHERFSDRSERFGRGQYRDGERSRDGDRDRDGERHKDGPRDFRDPEKKRSFKDEEHSWRVKGPLERKEVPKSREEPDEDGWTKVRR